jgi:subtilisin family serine protease
MALLSAVAASLLLASIALAATSSPNDPLFPQQWALQGRPGSINAPAAWCASTGSGVLVADIDTGADFNNPDLAGKLVPGVAFLNGDGSQTGSGQPAVQDNNYDPSNGSYGHGTMTTGIMAADTNNGQGIAAVAPDAKALIVKVLDKSGSGSDADVSAGIRWATDHGARVINLSLGPGIPLTGVASVIPSAIQYAAANDVAVAVAAGNSSLPAADYTMISSYALVVGGTGPQGEQAYYSNGLVGVNIYAPGGDDLNGNGGTNLNVVSTAIYVPGHTTGYAAGQGTSFAAPQVAGTLALLRARGMSAAQARQQIINTAVQRNGLPELDASRALGDSGASCGTASGAAGPPPAVANASRPRSPAPSRAPGATPARAATPSTKAPSPVALATPSPTPSSAASPAVTPSANAPARHGSGIPLAQVAGTTVAILAAGAAGVFLRRARR